MCRGWLYREVCNPLPTPLGSIVRLQATYPDRRVTLARSVRCAVCCRNCTEIAHHAVSALLDSHPTYVDVSLDVRNAFNSISRDAFMPLVKSHLPDLLPWIGSMYGETIPTSFMVNPTLPDLPPTKIIPQRGSRQGCPLVLSSLPWGCTPSCAPWPDLLVRNSGWVGNQLP